MSHDELPIDFLVQAHIRIAAREGVPMVIRRRGDNMNGTIILKINLLNGMAHVLNQVRYEDELVWCPASKKDPMTDQEAEHYMERQVMIDPDSWHIEIEDKQGRHWFPGRIMTF